jgi:ankyrin repeat protein
MSELHRAAYDGHPGWVQTCLSKGAQVDARDEKGYTALLWSCFRGRVGDQLAIAKLLANAGADLNAIVLPKGDGCLHLAAQSGNKELVQFLLDRGANINLVADELTALMVAIRSREVDIAKLLLARGADTTYKLHGRSAIDYAKYEGLHDLVRQFIVGV